MMRIKEVNIVFEKQILISANNNSLIEITIFMNDVSCLNSDS